MKNSADQPLISICITCYNAENSIENAIKSAKNQTWPNTEIIVVDDCSEDRSVDIIKTHKDIKLIEHKQNTGPGGARNTLVKHSHGDYIVFFDDDDFSFPNRLEVQYNKLIQSEKKYKTDLIACYCSGVRLYPNGYKVDIDAIGNTNIAPHGESIAERILFNGRKNKGWCYGGTPTCSLMCKTQVIKTLGNFDPSFRRVEDLDFAIRLSIAGGYFVGTKEKLFEQHATIGNDKTALKNLEAELQLVEKHQEFLKNKKAYYYAKKWPQLRYYHFEKKYLLFLATFLKILVRHPIKASSQLVVSAPKRLVHEIKMSKKKKTI